MDIRDLIPLTTEEEERQLDMAIALSLREEQLLDDELDRVTMMMIRQHCRRTPPLGGEEFGEPVNEELAEEVILADNLEEQEAAPGTSSSSLERVAPVGNFDGSFDGKAASSMSNQKKRLISFNDKKEPQEPACCIIVKKVNQQENEIENLEIIRPLHVAVALKHYECLHKLISCLPNCINLRNDEGESALYAATLVGDVIASRILIGNDADVNLTKNSFESPIFAAIGSDSGGEIVRDLIRAGANVNIRAYRGWTPLHEAVYRGNPHVLQLLLNHGGDVNMTDGFGVSPIFTAAACGRSECISTLVGAGGDMNLCCKSKRASPLHEACKQRHTSCVTSLLQYGADPHIDNSDGVLPIHLAAANGEESILFSLLEVTDRTRAESCGASPLHFAAKNDHYDVMQMLITHGYDVNNKLTPDKLLSYMDQRQTALFFAVSNGSLDAVELLLKAGAKTDLDKFKALWVAINQCEYEITNLLLEYGADVNARFVTPTLTGVAAVEYLYPASVAFALRDFKMLEMVVRAGADVRKCFQCNMGTLDHSLFGGDDVSKLSFCYHFNKDDINPEYCGAVIRLLLQFVGGNIQLCRRMKEVIHGCDDWDDIVSMLGNPLSLHHTCRLKIRCSLGQRRLHGSRNIEELPLPPVLRNYIAFTN